MVERIRRPKKFDEFLNELTNKDQGVFRTYKDALIFAACLGYNRSKRVEFKQTGEAVNLQVFSGNFDEMVINAIAIDELDDLLVLMKSRESEKTRVFEEYACGGLEIMKEELEFNNNSTESLLHLILMEKDGHPLLKNITSLGID